MPDEAGRSAAAVIWIRRSAQVSTCTARWGSKPSPQRFFRFFERSARLVTYHSMKP
jgi:hypothetical protein